MPSLKNFKQDVLLESEGWPPRIGFAEMMGICISCGKKNHEEVRVSKKDGSIWYTCPVNQSLCYVREARPDGEQEAVRGGG